MQCLPMWFLMKRTKFLAHGNWKAKKRIWEAHCRWPGSHRKKHSVTDCHRTYILIIREFHTEAAAWTEKTWLCQHIPVFLHQLITTKSRHHLSHAFPSYPYPYYTYMLPICYWDAVKDSQNAKVEPILQVWRDRELAKDHGGRAARWPLCEGHWIVIESMTCHWHRET
jgi:hypothetical protein